ncbi:hypothetical protein SAMN02745195_02330 [Thermoanaerobacter uzonensis DSM 18761]|uniref:Uncharacterized protein n=1 Tax=Thermoanaerobacter uzonensis DSM 18761 TaxID=1123369 RepID=A0A1M5AKW9_9THEO|nr:pilin [Thermoanaerobacter uzonensis]SHF30806.1 hypothetical protein SAMN02745195_02330 [Thermoanaerobacter uzonensis DSM 18761]
MNGITPVGEAQISAFLWKIANFVMDVGIVVAVIFIAVNGYRFYTSGHNPSRRTEAMMGLFWSILGGIVVVGAKFFAGVILGFKPQ